MLDLVASYAKLQLTPELGGGIAGLWCKDKPVLRPWSGNAADGPFALASNVLVPFSNRIENEFSFDGLTHVLPKNLDGEPFPIHGDGFQRPWLVAESGPTSACLRLDKGEIGPFRYEAEQRFSLENNRLQMSLTMTNRAELALPYGGGFHPWFPRDEETRLQANAPEYWPEDDSHLPAFSSSQAPPPDFDFSSSQPLPERWINAGFSGWTGHAQISQGKAAVSVELTSQTLSTAIIYSPEPQCGFFCFEPVSHPVNAHNLPGAPGLTVLQPGESLSFDMMLTWDGDDAL